MNDIRKLGEELYQKRYDAVMRGDWREVERIDNGGVEVISEPSMVDPKNFKEIAIALNLTEDQVYYSFKIGMEKMKKLAHDEQYGLTDFLGIDFSESEYPIY